MSNAIAFDVESDKKLFDGAGFDAGRGVDFEVLETNWSGNAQAYMKPHIVTAIDTVSLLQAAKDIRTAHLSKYGGTVAVVLMRGDHAWASRTNYYYYARYRGVFIGIWSSD